MLIIMQSEILCRKKPIIKGSTFFSSIHDFVPSINIVKKNVMLIKMHLAVFLALCKIKS